MIIKTSSMALNNLMITEPVLFVGDIDLLQEMEARGIARQKHMSMQAFEGLCQEIDSDYKNVDRFRLDQFFYQLVNRDACDRFKTKVKKLSQNKRINLYKQIAENGEANILHIINSF